MILAYSCDCLGLLECERHEIADLSLNEQANEAYDHVYLSLQQNVTKLIKCRI